MKTSTVIKIAFALTIPAYIWQGFVFSKMWKWFIAPSFGVGQISVAAGVGLMLLCSMVTNRGSKSSDGDDSNYGILGSAIGTHFAYPALVLVIGFIASRFMQ